MIGPYTVIGPLPLLFVGVKNDHFVFSFSSNYRGCDLRYCVECFGNACRNMLFLQKVCCKCLCYNVIIIP